MPHAGHRQILCGMNGQPDPQHRAAAPNELELVAAGMTALVAKRILETKDDAMSATKAAVDPGTRSGSSPQQDSPAQSPRSE